MSDEDKSPQAGRRQRRGSRKQTALAKPDPKAADTPVVADKRRIRKFDPAMLDELLEWIASGQTLREWCRQPGKPSHTTVYNWLDSNNEMALRFARAREDGHDAIAEQCRHLADLPPQDQVEVQWRRLQIETRLKLLAKWSPSKYGDRVGIEHGGGIVMNVITNVPR